ncbi:Predicted arabinose efflux permease, MFS family [Paenibacillus uliginis N3/975]|uniref:Predicted arabinose efflux permease, MFS family n=1 Tax=Paenibacillus uliginis N3/975 TaxID=1313296 RepID=A0A1X7HD23_9BACL|nr:MFS transporter [Paenibacillus uliginis]SMF84247.1 Predicted arabinose efflux permease, MFS family [Paenibacillus uliginis N3/975]
MNNQTAASAVQRNYSLMTIILCWSGLVIMSSLYVTIPLISVFAQLFSISTTEAAAAGSTFSIGFAIGCLIYGALSDKYGRKTVIFVGLLFLTIISLLLGFVHQFPWILILRGLQGAAAATFSPVALAYAVEMYPVEKRVTTIGFISTGFLIAGIVGQVISSLISEQYGWNAVFYILAVIYALTATLVFFFLPKGGIHQAHANIWEPIKQIGKVFVQKQLVLCYLVAFVLLMSFVSMYTVLGSYLSQSPFDLSKQDILYVRSIGIIGMLVSPFAGRISKRVGIRVTLRGGLLLAIIGLASMGMISNLPLLIVMSILFVGGIALAVPSLVSLVGQLGGKMRGIAVSVYTFILFTGTSFGPIISLQLMKSGSYLITFILLACILCIGLLAACLINREESE